MSAAYPSVCTGDHFIHWAGKQCRKLFSAFLLIEIVIYLKLLIFINFFQRHADKPDVTLKDGWKFEISGNEFRFDFGESES